MKIILGLFLAILLTSCSTQPSDGTQKSMTFGQLMSGASKVAVTSMLNNLSLPANYAHRSANRELLLFSGKVFLGCITCSDYDSNSIHNSFGQYGSSYSQTSIRNHFSKYGDNYSDTSVCNRYANNPPVIVDGNGGFYGVMTLNRYHRNYHNNANINDFLVNICQ